MVENGLTVSLRVGILVLSWILAPDADGLQESYHVVFVEHLKWLQWFGLQSVVFLAAFKINFLFFIGCSSM